MTDKNVDGLANLADQLRSENLPVAANFVDTIREKNDGDALVSALVTAISALERQGQAQIEQP